jgi:hypothetical protein
VIEVFLALPWQWLLWLGGIIAIAYLAICAYLVFWQTQFIFYPQAVIRSTPIAFNLDYEDIWLPVPTALGQTEYLHGWWIPASDREAPVWLFLHGNGSNIGDEIKHAFWFEQLGYSTLAIDYRGYGRSEGKFPKETSVYEDAEAAWTYLTQVRKVPPERIFVYGHSLGGAIGIELARRHPELAGLVVEGSFTSLRAMVDCTYPFWMFPIDLMLHQQFNSLSKVNALTMPVLFAHGTNDRVVPAHMSQTLFEAAPEPKKLLIVPEAGHQNVGELSGDDHFQAIQWVVEQAQSQPVQLAER